LTYVGQKTKDSSANAESKTKDRLAQRLVLTSNAEIRIFECRTCSPRLSYHELQLVTRNSKTKDSSANAESKTKDRLAQRLVLTSNSEIRVFECLTCSPRLSHHELQLVTCKSLVTRNSSFFILHS
jgi:hypothetical protein